MYIFAVVVVLVSMFLLFNLLSFFKYKRQEKMDKNEVGSYLIEGLSFEASIDRAFSNLNKYQNTGLSSLTIEKVITKISELQNIMTTDNAVEIYSTFVWRYIYRNGKNKKPKNLSEQKIIYALESLDFNEKNGYFILKSDKDEEIAKKYPD